MFQQQKFSLFTLWFGVCTFVCQETAKHKSNLCKLVEYYNNTHTKVLIELRKTKTIKFRNCKKRSYT